MAASSGLAHGSRLQFWYRGERCGDSLSSAFWKSVPMKRALFFSLLLAQFIFFKFRRRLSLSELQPVTQTSVSFARRARAAVAISRRSVSGGSVRNAHGGAGWPSALMLFRLFDRIVVPVTAQYMNQEASPSLNF